MYDFMTCLRDAACAILQADAAANPTRGYNLYCECQGDPCCNSEVAWCQPTIECCGISVWPGPWTIEKAQSAPGVATGRRAGGGCHAVPNVSIFLKFQACRPLEEDANPIVRRHEVNDQWSQFMIEVSEVLVCGILADMCSNTLCPTDVVSYDLQSVTCTDDAVVLSINAQLSC